MTNVFDNTYEMNKVKEAENELQEYEQSIQLRDCLYRLKSHKDFIKIIEEGFFGEFSKANIENLTGSHIDEKSVVDNLKAVSVLKSFLETIQQRANIADSNIEQTKETIRFYRASVAGGN